MKNLWSKVLALLAIGLLAAPASAQVSTTANGPYYPTPSWDQKLISNRFVILANWNNDAVLDRETGLVWERSPAGFETWAGALLYCMDLAVGGRKGWRLPSIHELASLVDPARANPALPAGHPFTANFLNGNARSALRTRGVNFFLDSGPVVVLDENDTWGVWCVRGGQGQ